MLNKVFPLVLMVWGGLELSDGNYEQAKNCFNESLTIKKKLANRKGAATDDHLNVAVSLGNLGDLYRKCRDHSKAKEYYQKEVSNCPSIKDKMLNRSLVINTLLNSYSRLYSML